jgi:hypothetical protein
MQSTTFVYESAPVLSSDPDPRWEDRPFRSRYHIEHIPADPKSTQGPWCVVDGLGERIVERRHTLDAARLELAHAERLHRVLNPDAAHDAYDRRAEEAAQWDRYFGLVEMSDRFILDHYPH